MRKKIVCILAAALFAVTLPLTADAKAGIRRGTENVPAESVTVTAEMIRTDANKKNGSSETVPWDPEALRGKTFSILGDSISTYRNTSNRRGSRWSNTTIGRGAAWYSDLKPKLGEDETWWMQLSEDLGLRLLVNNSWAGSGFFRPYRFYLDHSVYCAGAGNQYFRSHFTDQIHAVDFPMAEFPSLRRFSQSDWRKRRHQRFQGHDQKRDCFCGNTGLPG